MDGEVTPEVAPIAEFYAICAGAKTVVEGVAGPCTNYEAALTAGSLRLQQGQWTAFTVEKRYKLRA